MLRSSASAVLEVEILPRITARQQQTSQTHRYRERIKYVVVGDVINQRNNADMG
jgi:hypothetical protein